MDYTFFVVTFRGACPYDIFLVGTAGEAVFDVPRDQLAVNVVRIAPWIRAVDYRFVFFL